MGRWPRDDVDVYYMYKNIHSLQSAPGGPFQKRIGRSGADYSRLEQ